MYTQTTDMRSTFRRIFDILLMFENIQTPDYCLGYSSYMGIDEILWDFLSGNSTDLWVLPKSCVTLNKLLNLPEPIYLVSENIPFFHRFDLRRSHSKCSINNHLLPESIYSVS